jgi:hypothetical protein
VTTPVPTFCRLELWNPAKTDWSVAHAGIALLHPERYVARLAAKGKTARVILVDTGEVIYGEGLADIL